ncbi:hypothetical protein LTR78_002098 [Recurvomyces mirabilis]|uniref:Sister chromatid cohesion protein Dcc1 n=1 Tax=Recurvomyces mirabilis TaxID=574656 RepID=A0AAE1C4T5_9PEZI|nr:hypothetical protein LTR78_002098 [Recurvomyces mirabilis]KAK5160556.1 hypothetical protein LTS14_001568 [Recurvomyces mirabilis]
MSSQGHEAGKFSILPEESREQFRLLELPPDLLAILTSSEPQPLIFKSPRNLLGSLSEAEAVICTTNATYSIRQVNTSNSLYICQPTKADVEGDNDDTAALGLQAIAQNDFTLQPNQVKATSAVPYIRAVLPTYSSTGSYQSKDLLSRQQVFDSIPLSQAECEVSWRDLACFETQEPSGCFQPSSTAKAIAWKSVIGQAAASGVDLMAPLSRDQISILVDPNEEWPPELTRALLTSISTIEGDTLVIDAERCAVSTGLDLLAAAQQSRRTLRKAEFLAEWKDLLPEKWRGLAELEKLPRDQYSISDGDHVLLVGASTADGPVAAAETKKRKWHDKFRASKKAS